ncbi:MAG: tetratricopeptide repeat protein [Candidatus Omnitrophica bacterium]|nr:tetratricopeptide repeat protein [Candidatus Omnitrophota bacterium]
MKIIVCFIILFFNSILFAGAAAWDWRAIHERADVMDSKMILQLLQDKSDDIQLYYISGLVFLNEYNIVAAKAAFEKVTELDPLNIGGQWGLAEIARRERRFSDSEKVLKDIIKQQPRFAPALMTLAYINYLRGNFSEATRLCDIVASWGLKRVDTSNYLRALGLHAGAKGLIAYHGGLLSKAINGSFVFSTLKQGERIEPNSPVILMGLGSYYMLAPVFAGRDLKKAEDYLTRAEKIDPLYPDIYVRLAQLYFLKGDTKKYAEYLQKAFELDPQNELALDIKEGLCRFACVK